MNMTQSPQDSLKSRKISSGADLRNRTNRSIISRFGITFYGRKSRSTLAATDRTMCDVDCCHIYREFSRSHRDYTRPKKINDRR